MSLGAWAAFLCGITVGFFCALASGAFIGLTTAVERWLKRK